jgi:protein-S-isoprenylcysteine O-methyltransferase Ste14
MKFWKKIISLNHYLSTSVPPGPQLIKLKYVINFQKGGTLLFVWILMNYFQNFSTCAYLYLSLHGTYSLVWLLKDQVMPDKNWESKATLISAVISFSTVLLPYWMIAYLTIKNKYTITNLRLFLSTSIHTLGCVLMMSSDSQKYFTLLNQSGLISSGWFKKIRNTNYLGEMMIYGSYAGVSQSWISWIILGSIWTFLFIPNIINKDIRNFKKEGGSEYFRTSWRLIPFLW